MSEDKTNADVAALPFEAAMKELEGIVARLERGDVPLEESIAIYTRGEALKARCDALLKQAEGPAGLAESLNAAPPENRERVREALRRVI